MVPKGETKWQATVYGVTKSWTQLSDSLSLSHSHVHTHDFVHRSMYVVHGSMYVVHGSMYVVPQIQKTFWWQLIPRHLALGSILRQVQGVQLQITSQQTPQSNSNNKGDSKLLELLVLASQISTQADINLQGFFFLLK